MSYIWNLKLSEIVSMMGGNTVGEIIISVLAGLVVFYVLMLIWEGLLNCWDSTLELLDRTKQFFSRLKRREKSRF